MGAWIETVKLAQEQIRTQSHPSWVRGLKPSIADYLDKRNDVAPLVGAWIETADFDALGMEVSRTPRGCVD